MNTLNIICPNPGCKAPYELDESYVDSYKLEYSATMAGDTWQDPGVV